MRVRTHARVKANLLAWAVQLLLFGALWLLLANGVDPYEAIAAAVFAGIASGLATLVSATGLVRFHPDARWLSELVRLPWDIARGSLRVAFTLVRWRPGTHVDAIAFDPGGDDPVSVNRRAAATLLGTIAPDGVVIELDRDERVLRYHRLKPGAPPGASARLAKP